jgi:hypothetical protein
LFIPASVLRLVAFSSVFVETCGAHTLLGTVTRLFIPAYVHLCMDNLLVTYSGQTRGWSESTLILNNDSRIAITSLICVDQSQGLKSAKREREREREIIEMKKAPLLRRAALKISNTLYRRITLLSDPYEG